MDPMTIISAMTALIGLAARAIDAASAGKIDEARANLEAARRHFDDAQAAWDKAPGPSA
jgi:predicted lipid-binding transport protein (Tim44 family)